jgi:isoquinoline 1-oxidoreductase beta subunit
MPLEELTIQAGRVQHRSGKSAHFGELVAGAVQSPAPIVLKDRKDWKLIGQSAPRMDIPAKVDGTARFGIDVRLPGMLFAAVRMCPMLGGTVATLDDKAALALPGVKTLVKLDAVAGSTAGFAVVAKTSWHARTAVQAVQVQWQQRKEGALDSARIQQSLLDTLKNDKGFTFYEKGDAAAAEAGAARVIEASYTAPYLAHATMEPMNCTAQFKDGKLEVWAPTQVPGFARDVAARVAGLDVDHVTLHVTYMGGGFGRRLDIDFVAQAVRVAMACDGLPVQLLWSREEDTTHDLYRPMHVAQLRAAVDAQGRVSSLRIHSAGDAISPRWMERGLPALAGPFDTPDKTTAEGLFDLPYGFANQHMAHVATHSGVPVGFWRSVGHSHNAFFSEGFIDELAVETKQDPLAFRQSLLKDAPRHLAVLNLAAEKSAWGTPLPEGHARGIALHESFGSIVAEVVEVSLQDGKPRVHKVVCAVDCGTVINPGLVAQQMESAVVFALTAALYSRIDIIDGVVQQRNFDSYPMVTLAQAPPVETWLVPSTRPPSGVGEPGVPPLAPALANALFVLTGKRQRSLPLQA